MNAEKAQLIDLGAGMGKTMWHGGVAAMLKDAPNGVESDPLLCKKAKKMSDYLMSHFPKDATWRQDCFHKPEVRLSLGRK